MSHFNHRMLGIHQQVTLKPKADALYDLYNRFVNGEAVSDDEFDRVAHVVGIIDRMSDTHRPHELREMAQTKGVDISGLTTTQAVCLILA